MSIIRIGISSCLLGQKVRYDGGHKRDLFLVDTFGPYVEWVPVCPELEMGMGVPREPIHLRSDDEGVRLVGVKSGTDHTAGMEKYAKRRLDALAKLDLCGYVLKKDSPSCGLMRVKVWSAHAMPTKTGRGLFAAGLVERFPHLPVEEEGRLSDARLRENFIERVFAYARLKDLFAGRWTIGQLVAFHAAHKLLLLAHSPDAYRRLGRLVAGAARMDRAALRAEYESGFMEALAVLATRGRHMNVLQHMAGYFDDLDAASREELHQTIADYRAGLVPLIVPITLMRHHVRRLQVEYLAGQVYLEPHPKELMLRNHV
ncbi:MAG: YbgA family protein [Bacteroidales bacterium]